MYTEGLISLELLNWNVKWQYGCTCKEQYYSSSLIVILQGADFPCRSLGLLIVVASWIPALQKKPEEINRRSADMWSFAILLWELVTREVPFADLSNMEIGMKVSRVTFGSYHLWKKKKKVFLEFLFYFTKLIVCLIWLSGCPGGFEAHYPSWHITPHLQADEDMHERRSSKEA